MVYLTGDFANGKNSKTIDFILEGSNLDEHLIKKLVAQVETTLTRRIKFSINRSDENLNRQDKNKLLEIWQTKI